MKNRCSVVSRPRFYLEIFKEGREEFYFIIQKPTFYIIEGRKVDKADELIGDYSDKFLSAISKLNSLLTNFINFHCEEKIYKCNSFEKKVFEGVISDYNRRI